MKTPNWNIGLRLSALCAGFVIAPILWPHPGCAQENQTNTPAHYYVQMVSLLAGMVDSPASKSPRTFSTTFVLFRAEGLPKDLAGVELDFAFQAPDHLRIRASWNGQEVIVCRAAQEFWLHAPMEKFGFVSSSAMPGRTNDFGPFKLPISFAQLMLLPLFAEVKSLGDEDVGTVPCRVLELTPKPEAAQALPSLRGVLQLWLRKNDSMPLRLGYRDGRATDVQLTLVNPRIEPAWPAHRWKIKSNEGDHILNDANYFDGYDPHAPLNPVFQETIRPKNAPAAESYSVTPFTFDGYPGEKIPSLITRPLNSPATRLPAVIFLHGIGQNKSFLKVITEPFNRAGFVVATFDQLGQGERKPAHRDSPLASLATFLERPAKTINETRRLVDYLQSRPDIDPRRIYLVGASYGAIMGATVLAKDKRLRAGVLVYGGGNFSKLLDSKANRLFAAAALNQVRTSNLDPEKGPLPQLTPAQDRQAETTLNLIKPFADLFFGMADPVRYAGQISPTPVYFQNGTHDVLISTSAAKALQEAAGEPKKITWYDSDHVGVNREQTKQVLDDGLKWLLEQDKDFRQNSR